MVSQIWSYFDYAYAMYATFPFDNDIKSPPFCYIDVIIHITFAYYFI